MKSKSGNPSLSVNAILSALWQHDKSKQFYPNLRDSHLNKPRLNLLIPACYFESSPAREQFLQKIIETNGLSCLMNAKYAHSGIKADLREISNELLSPAGYKKFLQAPHDCFINEYCKSEQLCADIPEEIKAHPLKSHESGSAEDYIIRELQFLYNKKEFGEFFWWLLLKALLQPSANLLLNRMPHNTQYRTILDWLPPSTKHQFSHSQMAEIAEDHFWNLRKELIRSARGHLIIAGPSLMDAFNPSAPLNKCIVDAIKEGVNAKQLEKLSIILTDPILFESCESCNQPILDTSWAVTTIEDSLYDLFERNQIELHIYFLPMLQIDHAVITEEFLAMRSTKLWTKEREFKGAFVLYLSDCYIKASSEYRAHKKYLQTIMENSTGIYPDVDTDTNILGDGSARSRHMQWRKRLRDKNYQYIFMHKLYYKQLSTFVCNSWRLREILSSRFIANSGIKNYEELFNYRNLLGDETQRVLLDYLKETESLFNQVIQKHNPSSCKGCQIFPSLDLGMPNNVQRLAGGFATGMLVTWDCGIDIVPIDATVNVCTSSVFKLDNFDPELLSYRENVDKALKKIFDLATEEKGYSFSFTSGNHFLVIGTSMSPQGNKEYYLVLHSSANELKNSYMGLYPVEENWYSHAIKHLNGQNGRYFRYLKDDTARHFISMAHHFEQYNEQIHQWLARMINDDKPCNKYWINHHYYMPTDTSIAIGTFAEPVGKEVPIFSSPGKPIYIFEIGADNWKIDLGGNRGLVCLVPHGWGQKIDHLRSIRVEDKNLVLDIGERLQQFPINSKRRIECHEKMLRSFDSGEEFLKIGSKYVHGDIKKVIIPCYEYSLNTKKNLEK